MDISNDYKAYHPSAMIIAILTSYRTSSLKRYIITKTLYAYLQAQPSITIYNENGVLHTGFHASNAILVLRIGAVFSLVPPKNPTTAE